ncbi:MAG: efflux RND transporter periplasmic adaptor subunit [Desulfobacteraceae bacterium]|nr:efflux RND transporter periplasmic adaptor subunit [Desulfobacteraceae bacterium]
MSTQKKEVSVTSLLIKIILPVCIILSGVAGWSYFMAREPKMKRKPPKKQAILVQTLSMNPGNYQSSINAMGTVMPDKQILLKSKVSGEVVYISSNFVEGAVIQKGELLLKLEEDDYKIDVQKAQSALDKSLSALALEQGSQSIAKEELELINEALKDSIESTDLALRKPQLVQAKASVDSARADLKKAKLNLSRTRVVIPFNALILEKHVNAGSLVNAQGSIATLVDVDAYKIEAQVPPDRLASVMTGETTGSKAIIHSNYSNHTFKGKVVRTTGKMTDKSRMAGVIVLVPDPLGLKNHKKGQQLLLDDHVNVKIFGETLENVFAIPRSALRDNNTLWVYNAGVLAIKKVSLAWKEDGMVYIQSGINPGDKVIISEIPVAINGMALQIASGDNS